MTVMRIKTSQIPERHGDLILIPVGHLKEPGKTTENVLAYGETTGHRHSLRGQCLVYEAPQKKLAELYPELANVENLKDAVPSKYLMAQEALELVHEDGSGQKADHEMLRIPEGNYVVVQEREFDFFEQEIRRVSD